MHQRIASVGIYTCVSLPCQFREGRPHRRRSPHIPRLGGRTDERARTFWRRPSATSLTVSHRSSKPTAACARVFATRLETLPMGLKCAAPFWFDPCPRLWVLPFKSFLDNNEPAESELRKMAR